MVLNSNSTFSIEQRKQVNEIKLSLHLNLAAVKLKLKSFNEAIEHCSKVFLDLNFYDFLLFSFLLMTRTFLGFRN